VRALAECYSERAASTDVESADELVKYLLAGVDV
jgi:hypothetical protein